MIFPCAGIRPDTYWKDAIYWGVLTLSLAVTASLCQEMSMTLVSNTRLLENRLKMDVRTAA